MDWSLGWMPFSPSLFPNAAGRKRGGKERGEDLAKKHELALSVLPLLFLSLAAFLFSSLLSGKLSDAHAGKEERTFSSLIGRTNICQKGVLTGGGRRNAHVEERGKCSWLGTQIKRDTAAAAASRFLGEKRALDVDGLFVFSSSSSFLSLAPPVQTLDGLGNGLLRTYFTFPPWHPLQPSSLRTIRIHA